MLFHLCISNEIFLFFFPLLSSHCTLEGKFKSPNSLNQCIPQRANTLPLTSGAVTWKSLLWNSPDYPYMAEIDPHILEYNTLESPSAGERGGRQLHLIIVMFGSIQRNILWVFLVGGYSFNHNHLGMLQEAFGNTVDSFMFPFLWNPSSDFTSGILVHLSQYFLHLIFNPQYETQI